MILLLVIGMALGGCIVIIVAHPNATVALDWGLPLTVSGPSVETHTEVQPNGR